MGSETIIRDCRPADMTKVTAIYGHAVIHGTGTFEVEPPDEAEMTARHARVTGRGYPFLVACVGDDLLGFAYAAAYREREAYRFTVEDSLYVHPGRMGRGVGSALLNRLTVLCAAAGFRQMIAVIGDSSNTASIGVHRSVGFDQVGILRAAGWKNDRWIDVVLMQRALGSGDAPPLLR